MATNLFNPWRLHCTYCSIHWRLKGHGAFRQTDTQPRGRQWRWTGLIWDKKPRFALITPLHSPSATWGVFLLLLTPLCKKSGLVKAQIGHTAVWKADTNGWEIDTSRQSTSPSLFPLCAFREVWIIMEQFLATSTLNTRFSSEWIKNNISTMEKRNKINTMFNKRNHDTEAYWCRMGRDIRDTLVL